MNELDRNSICLRVSVDIVKSLKLNPETEHLQSMTPEHTDAWIQGLEEIIDDLTTSLNMTKERYKK